MPSQSCLGLGPSLYVACYHFTGYSETDFSRSTHAKFSQTMNSFQFGVGCLDP